MASTKYKLEHIAELTGHEDRVCPSIQLQAIFNPRPHINSHTKRNTSRLPAAATLPTLKFTTQSSVPTGHAKTVRCVTWAPSGKTFATASFDANIAIWEQESSESDDNESEGGGGGGIDEDGVKKGEWECACLLEGHETECKSIAYSSSGTLLASCSRDKTVWVWEVQPDSDFECMGVLMTHTQDVKCVTWHPTEEILASGSYDNTIKLYIDDPSDDWYDFQTLTGHTSTVWSLAFSPAAPSSLRPPTTKRLGFGGASRSGGGRACWGGKEEEGTGTDKGLLASTGGDGKINVWSIKTEGDAVVSNLIASIEDAHGVSEVNCVSWCPRPGLEHLLASAGDDCSVRIWDLRSESQ
ncbi:WD40 domain containing protein [Pyrrhoderma noxium]|uniref:Probable cytosolic iron-sulfur protein assembly protein 1 n=1 Tax=Pyrrhoderma noxium TaxID=2282107 RepID=A0A286ULC7_9AGAM|nr:WD40 domain containing protein [Pyrrhoderma noxium]